MTTATTTSPEELADKLLTKVDERIKSLRDDMRADQANALAAFKAEHLQKAANALVPGLDPKDKEVKEFSFARLVKGATQALRRGDVAMKEICPMEYELHLAAEKVQKDQNSGTDSAGGYLVPAQVMNAKLVPLLQERLVLDQLGVMHMNGLVGSPVEIPKVTGGTTGYWVNHDISDPAAVTKSDATFGQVEMRPRTAAAATRLSNRLINQSTPAAETLIQNQIAKDLGLLIETAAFNGSGTSGQPKGVLQATGIGSVSSVGSVAASTFYDKAVDMLVALRLARKDLPASAKWVMNPAIWGALVKTKDPTDASQPKARRLIHEKPETMLLGHQYVVTGNVPDNTLVVGDWIDLIIGHWGGLVVKVDDLSVLRLLQTQVLTSMEVDVLTLQPESFVKGLSVTV